MATATPSMQTVEEPTEVRWFRWLIGATYALELVSMAARYVLIKIITYIVLLVVGLVLGLGSLISSPLAAIAGENLQGAFAILALINLTGTVLVFLLVFVPPFVSLAFFITNSNSLLGALFGARFGMANPGGLLTRFVLGARDVGLREVETVNKALESVLSRAPDQAFWENRKPYIFVLPNLIEENAFAIGNTIYVTQKLIKSPHLRPMLAHELGHIAQGDARLTRALRYLVLPIPYLLSNTTGQAAPGTVTMNLATGNATGCLAASVIWFLNFLLSLSSGGFGLWLLNPLWVMYWRNREYEADRYAFECGEGTNLEKYLDAHRHQDVATPFFMTNIPYTEQRIDRLLQLKQEKAIRQAQAQGVIASPTLEATPDTTGDGVDAV